MADTESSPTSLRTGANGAYQWLTTEHQLDVLLQLCPDTLLGKYLAVTSIDSGFLAMNEELESAGWASRNRIAYSPQIQSVERLPHDGYDEWYVFDAPMDLGEVSDGNPFNTPLQRGRIVVFVNYGGFALHDAQLQPLIDMFWRQLEWINPESYLADGSDNLTFVSRNRALFEAVRRALGHSGA